MRVPHTSNCSYSSPRSRETLRELVGPLDFMLNDGFPNAALDALKLVAPEMRSGSALVTDNVGAFWSDCTAHLEWLRDPRNGFRSGLLELNQGTEFSTRVTVTH